MGAPLVVLNLSQQTDSSDLLGGFRPVQPRDALLPLLARLQARAHLCFMVCVQSLQEWHLAVALTRATGLQALFQCYRGQVVQLCSILAALCL